jgi:hypothetical protein
MTEYTKNIAQTILGQMARGKRQKLGDTKENGCMAWRKRGKMAKRILKKYARSWMDNFTKTKIPAAFKTEAERLDYVRTWARARAGYPNKWDRAKEA